MKLNAPLGGGSLMICLVGIMVLLAVGGVRLATQGSMLDRVGYVQGKVTFGLGKVLHKFCGSYS